MGKNTEGLDSGNAEKQMGLGLKSQKKKGKNSSSAPKSAMAAKESNFDDNKRVRSKKKVLLPLIDSPRKDEPESETESNEEEEGIPSSDEEKRKNKTKKKKPLVDKNDGSDSESDEEEENAEPKQIEGKEKDSKSGEKNGAETSSSEDEDNQKKASDKAPDESDDSAAEKGEEISKCDETDGKQKKPIVDSANLLFDEVTGSSDVNHEYSTENGEVNGGNKEQKSSRAVKKKAAAQEANQRPCTRSSLGISGDTVPENETPAKRLAENCDVTEPKTRDSKRVARGEAVKPFQRVWSEKDETLLLKGVIEYCKAKDVEISMVDNQGLFEFIEGSCRFHFEPNRIQLREKIWKLKKKYEKHSKRADHSNMVPHEMKVFKLSRKVWGALNDGVATEATKDEEAEMVTKVQNAHQQLSVEEQLKQFGFRECDLYVKRLELMTEKTLLNLEQRFLSSVKKDD